jgi:hypothetical protein
MKTIRVVVAKPNHSAEIKTVSPDDLQSEVGGYLDRKRSQIRATLPRQHEEKPRSDAVMSELTKLCEERGVKITCQYGGVEIPEGWTRDTHPYKVKLTYQGRSFTTPFFQGSAHTKEPTAADVLSCVCMDASFGEQSFEDFCSDLGYDPDSRKAEQTWKTCVRMAPKVRRLLGKDFEMFANAEH